MARKTSPSRLLKYVVFLQLARRYRATDIFDGCKPLKMGAIRKPRCQTGRLNAAERRDARERRSDGDVEKAMDGFFNNLLDPLGSLNSLGTWCPVP